MILKNLSLLYFLSLYSLSVFAQQLAFPTAQGFGKYTTGGRGGKVYKVTNLNDDGEGSFRAAATAKHPRIIVFDVSGTIHLKSSLDISKNVSIYGQTAPGDGICLADYPVSLAGDNIIVRYLRFRMGDRFQNTGMVDKAGSDDAFGGKGRKNIIIDHCSISWSTDEVMSVYRGDSTTLQWNILSEPLNYSYHFEEGDKDFEKHGYGGIWGGNHLSAHHNLFAHCASRNPRFNGARLGAKQEFVDFRNNVIYNWGHNNIYGGEGGNYNIVNNYFKYGPSTNPNVKSRIVNPSKGESVIGKFFVQGNFVDGFDDVTKNNDLGVQLEKGTTALDKENALIKIPFNTMPLTEKPAVFAYDDVLKSAGASFRRDTLDQRIIKNVKDRTGNFIDVQGGFKHGTVYEETVNAWPKLKFKKPKKDKDRDGMPDVWEKKNGLNPKINDASLNTLESGYDNIEVYINQLVKD
jgi:pectate lyase